MTAGNELIGEPPPIDFTVPLKRGPTWKQKDGSLILIEEMDDHHLLCSARSVFKRFKHFVVQLNLSNNTSTPWNDKHVVRFGKPGEGKLVRFVEVLRNSQEPFSTHLYLQTISPAYANISSELIARGYTDKQVLDFYIPQDLQEFL